MALGFGLVFGLAFSILVVGLEVVLAMVLACRFAGRFAYVLAESLLGVEMERPASHRTRASASSGRSGATSTTASPGWRSCSSR